MISITSAQLDAWIAALLFPLIRILAMLATAPVVGNKQVPRRVKVGLAALLALIVAPTLPPFPQVALGSAQGLLILAQEILIGTAMGFTLRVVFTSVEMAGEIAGLQMGLGFASFYDPMNSSYSPIIARWLGMIAALAFLTANGHLYMLSALVESFYRLPVGDALPSGSLHIIAQWGGSIFAFGLQMSLPIVAALLITNIALGILTRAAPQLNLFAVGFPITLSIGFIILALSIPNLSPLFDKIFLEGVGKMLEIVSANN